MEALMHSYSRAFRAVVCFAAAGAAGCATPLVVHPPAWHPANAEATAGPGTGTPRTLAASEPVDPADRGVVPPNAGMTGGMPMDHSMHAAGGEATGPGAYTCPMHPEVITDAPGKCPKCGMRLIKKKPGAEK
jgi:hypothetical protein